MYLVDTKIGSYLLFNKKSNTKKNLQGLQGLFANGFGTNCQRDSMLNIYTLIDNRIPRTEGILGDAGTHKIPRTEGILGEVVTH